MQKRAKVRNAARKNILVKRRDEMSNPVDDFVASFKTVYGEGFFEGNLTAVHYAQSMSKSQRRKYRRYGTIPKAFFDYLKNALGVDRNSLSSNTRIEKGKSVPVKKDPTGELLELLWSSPYKDRTSSCEREILRMEILMDEFPMLRRSQASGKNLWERIAAG
jgi:hypothetical protein